MADSRATAAKNAPQSRKGRDQKPDSRIADASRKSETLSPGVALQALRLGVRLSPEQVENLSHTVGNRALEELLSASNGVELVRRPLPVGDLQTEPLSVPDSAPEAPVMTVSPAWSGGDTQS